MRLAHLALVVLFSIPLALNVGCSDDGDGGGSGGSAGDGGSGGSAGGGGSGGGGGGTPAPEPYAANICIGDKQDAAGAFCKSALDAWATWTGDPTNNTNRDAAIAAAQGVLDTAWDAAEAGADDEGADCANLALASEDAGAATEAGISRIAGAIIMDLDLDDTEQAQCAADLITAAGVACEEVLAAESSHISDLWADTDRATLEAAIESATSDFASAWAEAVSGVNCPTNATDEQIAGELEALTGALVRDTIVSPGLLDTEYTTLTPQPTVDYLGRTYEPQCMQGDQYNFFARRGSVNKLVMYYQGGGACWDGFTCGDVVEGVTPTCKTNANDDPNTPRGGFGDLSNDANPFQDWHTVFVTYCTCDIHFGDVTQEYPGVTVQHKGYHNAKVAERWAREHFYNPEEIFVTGSSAGAYGAWFNGPLLHEVWPASQIHVLADAGNGVITPEFLQNEFENWNFVENLPPIPGVMEAITTGDGMPAYTEAVAKFFPDTNWAHYSTMYDGGNGGQTGFYHLMVKDIFDRNWWESSCDWGDIALSQSLTTREAVPDNYRYYFGSGSAHTMFGNNKVYSDTTGNVPTIVSWVNGMLDSEPGAPDDAWTYVLCDDCSLLLPGDPDPRGNPPVNPLLPPFFEDGEDIRIICTEQ